MAPNHEFREAIRGKNGVKLYPSLPVNWDQQYHHYAELRKSSPVFWDEEFQSWVFTRYDEVNTLARDKRFDLNRIIPNKLAGLNEADRRAVEPIATFISTWMIYNQDPTHADLKRPMAELFRSKRLQGMGKKVEAIARGFCNEIKASGTNEIDFIRDYAHPIPAFVLGGMLGVPDNRITEFLGWSDQLAEFMQDFVVSEHPDANLAAVTATTIDEMKAFFGEALRARREKANGDQLSHLVQNSQLEIDVLRNQCIHMMFGGHKVPEFLAGTMGYLIGTRPTLRTRIERDKESLARLVIEAIRFESPIQFITRAANETVEVCGSTIKEGDSVLLVIGAANRDAAVFRAPDTLDLDRQDNRHLGFGAGTHYCLGMPLVVTELTALFKVFFEEFPDWKLIDEGADPCWSSNATFHGLKELKLRLS